METRHQCMIYAGSPAKQLPGLASLIREKLRGDVRCLYLNAPPMLAGLRSYLAATGLDVAREVANGALVLSSGQGHMKDRRFDAEGLLSVLADETDRALHEGYKGLWAAGDMTWEFGPEKNFAKLREYEYGLEDLFRKKSALQGICQYHTDTLPVDVVEEALYTHRACYINETLSRMNPYYVPPESPVRANVPYGQLAQMLANPGGRVER